MDRVLIDTSAWIAYFRKTGPHHALVARLLSEECVCSAGLIVAELIQGAKSGKEISVLKDFSHTFPFLPETTGTWEAAGELSFRLRKKGMTVGLADCFIATLAHESRVALLTLDAHFESIRTEVPIRLVS